mgnify:CR=1 FL=1
MQVNIIKTIAIGLPVRIKESPRIACKNKKSHRSCLWLRDQQTLTRTAFPIADAGCGVAKA